MGHVDLESMEPYQHHELDSLRRAIDQRNRQKTLVRFAGIGSERLNR